MAISFIKNHGCTKRDATKPFVLFVSFTPPHNPYNEVPLKFLDKYSSISIEELCQNPNIPPPGTPMGDFYRENIKGYLALVTGVDEHFGRILKALEDKGIADNTIVLFTSNHGNCLGAHNAQDKNNFYEESLRIPFLLRWRGKIVPRQDNLLISSPDIYPTLLGLMGFSEVMNGDIEGVSYADMILQQGEGYRPSSQPYFRLDQMRDLSLGIRGVRTHTHTLAVLKSPDGSQNLELYNRREDPYQLYNIATENPDVAEQLIREELNPWLYKIGDPWLEL